MLEYGAVFIVIAIGSVLVLGSVLVKNVDETRRGLFCWTISTLSFVISAVIFFLQIDGISFNFRQLISGLTSLFVCALLALAAEIISPSKRLRKREKDLKDIQSGERSFNFVAMIICAVLAAVCAAASAFDEVSLVLLAVIPAAAISMRQLSYYLSSASTGKQSEQDQKFAIKKRLMTNDKKL